MSPVLRRILRVPLTVVVVWAVLALAVPRFMSMAEPYTIRPGLDCYGNSAPDPAQGIPEGVCFSLAQHYHVPVVDLLVDSMFRSLALLAGAALLALAVGTLIGVAAALLRRRAFASAGIVVTTAVVAAVPSFFAAYFLQIFVILIGPAAGRGRFLPVYGFGYDEHLILPLLSISLAAIAFTAQLTATRLADVLDSDFITTANAKGLPTSWILAIHALPHVRPAILEALGSGLRVSVASLPIVEYLFLWRGLGQLSLEAVSVLDAVVFVFSAVVLTGLFATLSAIADISRPNVLYRGT